MTIDARGRVVVAGRGYVKVLHDDDQDGTADRATLFSERPKSGAHGILFVGDDLFATGDDGLWVQRDADGDGVADGLNNTGDGTREKWTYLKHPEHGHPSATRRTASMLRPTPVRPRRSGRRPALRSR